MGLFARILVASDAGRGSAGVLVVRNSGKPEESRYGRSIEIPLDIYSLWGDRKTYIAQLESWQCSLPWLRWPV